MYEQHTHRAAPPRTVKQECCTEGECESGLRNNYYKGKRLTPDSFRVEQSYLVERRRLLNRAIHGWGVVYGYAVGAAPPDECRNETVSGRVEIGAGLALDACGRELLQVRPLEIAFDDVYFVTAEGARIDPERAFAAAEEVARKRGPESVCWLLRAHYAEQYVGPVSIDDPCSCVRKQWNHMCETVRFSLQPIDCSDCCVDFPCELHCDCGTGPCCEEPVSHDDPKHHLEPQRAPRTHPRRGGCRCLCDHLTRLELAGDCGRFCEIEEPCAHVRVSFEHGVPLACVKLVEDECGRRAFDTQLEACGPRRLVKRNDLLFDLIRGCDLTRIKEIGWREWHRSTDQVPFKAFDEAFGNEITDVLGPDGEVIYGPDDQPERECVTDMFWVEFSRPVRTHTIRPDCFAMTIMSAEGEGGWWHAARVPITRVETLPEPDAQDLTRKVTIVVDGRWLGDAVRGDRTVFHRDVTSVEVEIRGDFIVDCNGQTVDANAVGISRDATGNGTPGGTFLSSFRVGRDSDRPGRHTRTDPRAHRTRGVAS